MSVIKQRRCYIDSLYRFLGDPDGLSQKKIKADLEANGIDTEALIKKVKEFESIIREVRRKRGSLFIGERLNIPDD